MSIPLINICCGFRVEVVDRIDYTEILNQILIDVRNHQVTASVDLSAVIGRLEEILVSIDNLSLAVGAKVNTINNAVTNLHNDFLAIVSSIVDFKSSTLLALEALTSSVVKEGDETQAAINNLAIKVDKLGQINELPSYDVSLTIVSETGLIFTIPEGTTELAIVTENCVPFLCEDEIYEGKFFARGFRSVGNNAIVNLKKEIIVDAKVTMFVAYTALRDIGEISVTSGAANIKRNTKRDLPVPQDSISDDLSSLIDLARSATTEGSST